jgi:hypothetical protein
VKRRPPRASKQAQASRRDPRQSGDAASEYSDHTKHCAQCKRAAKVSAMCALGQHLANKLTMRESEGKGNDG